MSTQADTKVNTLNEVVEVQGNKLIETVKRILAKGNVGRLVIYSANGDKLLNIPYAGGLTITALTTVFIPWLAVLTPIALLLGRFKIEIVPLEEQEVPTLEVEVEIEAAAPAEEPEADDLKKITGIGKVFEARLHEAGIYSFAQLAETPAEKIKEIVSPDKADQLFDVEPWIDQARELSKMAF